MISDQIEMYSLWKGNEKAYKLSISEVSNDYILRNDADTDEILKVTWYHFYSKSS